MKKHNFVTLLSKYTRGWVSISPDYKKVVASASGLPALLKRLERMGNPKGYLMRVAKDYSRYIGS